MIFPGSIIGIISWAIVMVVWSYYQIWKNGLHFYRATWIFQLAVPIVMAIFVVNLLRITTKHIIIVGKPENNREMMWSFNVWGNYKLRYKNHVISTKKMRSCTTYMCNFSERKLILYPVGYSWGGKYEPKEESVFYKNKTIKKVPHEIYEKFTTPPDKISQFSLLNITQWLFRTGTTKWILDYATKDGIPYHLKYKAYRKAVSELKESCPMEITDSIFVDDISFRNDSLTLFVHWLTPPPSQTLEESEDNTDSLDYYLMKIFSYMYIIGNKDFSNVISDVADLGVTFSMSHKWNGKDKAEMITFEKEDLKWILDK